MNLHQIQRMTDASLPDEREEYVSARYQHPVTEAWHEVGCFVTFHEGTDYFSLSEPQVSVADMTLSDAWLIDPGSFLLIAAEAAIHDKCEEVLHSRSHEPDETTDDYYDEVSADCEEF